MHQFPDIVVVNRRKIKKVLKSIKMSPQTVKGICDTYRGVFVICGKEDESNYIVISHIPSLPEIHLKQRGIAHQLTKRIRKGNQAYAQKLTVEK